MKNSKKVLKAKKDMLADIGAVSVLKESLLLDEDDRILGITSEIEQAIQSLNEESSRIEADNKIEDLLGKIE